MTGQRFDPAELHIPGEPDPPPAELADALATARDLEELAFDTGIRPTDGFEDRVMAAIAAEPAPRLVIVPSSAVRGGAVGAFLLTVRRSWAVAMAGGRPIAVRAQALAFVLLVLLAAGALTGVTAVTVGALLAPNGSTIGPDRSPGPTTPAAPETSNSPMPSRSPMPEVTVSPTESPEAAETAEPTETPRPPRTAKPGETPRATRTPRPTETPEGTDDHGGGGGPGSDDGGGGGGGKGPG
ncbi:MAG: hypothetical protein ACJ78H_14650 [Chloroflexota bacterium]